MVVVVVAMAEQFCSRHILFRVFGTAQLGRQQFCRLLTPYHYAPFPQAAESLAEEMVKDFATRAKKEAQQRGIGRSSEK